MDWDTVLYPQREEKPLDRLVDGYSHTSLFRTVAFIGDSLSSGEFETRDEDGTPHYYDMYPYSWGQFLARKNGLTALNFSRGGMTAKEYVESFAEEHGYWDADKACQAYVVALGVNDLLNHRIDLGSIDDIDPAHPKNNRPTFAGYYAAILSRYRRLAPEAPFFLVTIPKSDDPLAAEVAPRMRDLLSDMTECFKHTYLIDLYEYAPVYDARFREHYYLHGHMSPAGYLLTARLIDSYIDYIVRHNPEDFKTIGFVGTDIPH